MPLGGEAPERTNTCSGPPSRAYECPFTMAKFHAKCRKDVNSNKPNKLKAWDEKRNKNIEKEKLDLICIKATISIPF